jgi:hypothetical protein
MRWWFLQFFVFLVDENNQNQSFSLLLWNYVNNFEIASQKEVLPVHGLRDHLFGIVDEIHHFCCVGHHGVLLERTLRPAPL